MTRQIPLTRAAAATEGRVFALELALRDAQVVGTIRKYLEGRAVPYNVSTDTGWYREIFAPGAFTKSIREAANSLPLLLFHDSRSMDTNIGVAVSWEERADGLWGVWKLSEAEHAQRAAKMAEPGEDGTPPQLGYMSVGFQPIRSESFYDENELLTITRHEARLLEVSLTPTPSYKDAVVVKVRHRETLLHPQISGRQLDGWKNWLSEARLA